MSARFFLLALLCLALLQLLSCASNGKKTVPQDPAFQESTIRLPETGAEFFRHRVRLSLPGQEVPFAFDGLMMLFEGPAGAPEERRALLAGLSGMGLRLFSLLVDKEGLRLEYLHPSLAWIPRLEEYIARCVRVLWLGEEIEEHREQVWASLERPWPERLTFTHTAPDFTVDIHLVEHRRTEADSEEHSIPKPGKGRVLP